MGGAAGSWLESTGAETEGGDGNVIETREEKVAGSHPWVCITSETCREAISKVCLFILVCGSFLRISSLFEGWLTVSVKDGLLNLISYPKNVCQIPPLLHYLSKKLSTHLAWWHANEFRIDYCVSISTNNRNYFQENGIQVHLSQFVLVSNTYRHLWVWPSFMQRKLVLE